MNILFVDQFSEPGGAQLCLMALLPEIQRRGWHPRLMVPGNGALVKKAADLGIPVHPLPLGTYSNVRKNARDLIRFALDLRRMKQALRSAIAEHQIDLVYVNGPRIMPAAQGLPVPVVFHAHSIVSGGAAWLLARALKNTRATTIAASAFVARRITGAEVIYNGMADLSAVARAPRTGLPRVGILGRIAPEKGHLDFMRAATAVAGATFHIFGASLFSDPAYAAQVTAVAPPDRTEFTGWTDDIGAALRSLDILTVPSGPAEAATRVIMEAFSAGTPVIAYRSGGIPELVDHERTGLLIEPSHAALAQAIERLIKDTDLRQRFAAAGREEWRKRFTLDVFRDAVCQVIARAADAGPTTR